jgi:hypothetical protein
VRSRCGGAGKPRAFASAAVMVSLVAVAVGGAPTRAQVSQAVFTIQATNDSGSGSYVAAFDDGVWDSEEQTFDWALAGQVDLYDEDTSEWVASLLGATLFVRAAQIGEIELNIGVISGDSLTTFVVGSPLMRFSSTIPETFAQGRATASLTLTDALGDGATLTGLGPVGSGIYRSYYNGYLSDGTRFTHLVGLISVGPGGTATGSQSDPLAGFRPIGESVDDISAEIAFTLTPADLAFATTVVGVPEPEPCFGDLNGDGVIDASDIGVLLAAYGACEGAPSYDPDVDLDESGCVDIDDLVMLLAVYGHECW